MNFTQTLGTAIYNQLTASSDLTTLLGGTYIYYIQAPDNTDPPYIVWNWQSAVDENLTPSRMWNGIVNVRAFCASPSQAGSADSYVDTQLNGAALSVSGWTNFYSSREFFFSDVVDEPNTVKTYVIGGFYRIRIGS